MYLAWTTVGTSAEAERLAGEAVAAGVAACAQIDGPIVSHFRWQGKAERAEEFRLCFKALPAQLAALEKLVMSAHPYDTPEWVVIQTDYVAQKYLSWAETTLHTPPL